VISRTDLLNKHADLAEQAYIRIVDTERARPSKRLFEDRGVALEVAVPVLGLDDRVTGALYGGVLLNRRHALVDKIRNAVFGDNIYQGKPLGTVTIFLGDVRIATNVMKADSTRALGTRVSEEVYRKVLERGERFADRAFVVNDWYLSAYDPIKDPNGNTIGILYVGLLERKYLDYGSRLTMEFLYIGLAALTFSVGLAFFLSGRFRRPVVRLVEATRALSAGRLDTRVQIDEGSREMRELANVFNSMAQSLETRNRQLEEASKALKAAYTEADEKNRAYLEMLGFVTHELKSPLATIVFSIGSLREFTLGPLTPAQESLLKACANSADYLHSTIGNYLNLSRIEDGQLQLKLRRIPVRAAAVDPVIQRLAEMAADNQMSILCDIPHSLEVTCDADLLVSVFQNLISNALKYGGKGGRIEIKMERGAEPGFVSFSVFNEGPGFSEEDAKVLFTKFSRFSSERFDTKSGTGLGLFVTKTIVEKHGGKIWANSEPGLWARFTFTLRENPTADQKAVAPSSDVPA
jgi:two-component system NtrC family sensor kinase